MTDQSMTDGWQEHRLLVLAMLERHDQDIEACKDEYHRQREECERRTGDLRAGLEERMDERFKQLSDMHQKLIEHAADNILAKLEVPAEVQAAKVTGTWQFWATLVSSLTALIVAVIALMN